MTNIKALFTPFTEGQARNLKKGLSTLGLEEFFDQETVVEIEDPSERITRLVDLIGDRNWIVVSAGAVGIVFYLVSPTADPTWDGILLLPFSSIKSICTVSVERITDSLQKRGSQS
jgi:hypothetical protein